MVKQLATLLLLLACLGATDLAAQTPKPPSKKKSIPRTRLAQVNIYFETGMALLTDRHKEQIDSLIAFIDSLDEEKFRFDSILINAHTDNVGDSVANIKLSEKRAATLKEYLTDNQVDADRISYKFYGENEPIANNETDEGRALNRRVEMIVKYSLKPKVPPKKEVAAVDTCATDTLLLFENGVLITINRCAASAIRVFPWPEDNYASTGIRTYDEKLNLLMLEDVYAVETLRDTCFKAQYTIKIPIRSKADPKQFVVYLHSPKGWKTFPKAKLTKLKKKNYIQYKAKCGIDLAIGYVSKKNYAVKFKIGGGYSLTDVEVLYRDSAIYGFYGKHLRPPSGSFSTILPEPFCDPVVTCRALSQNGDTLYLPPTPLSRLKASYVMGYLPTGEKLEKKFLGIFTLKEKKLYKTYYLPKDALKRTQF